MGDAEVGVSSAFRRWELRPSRGHHFLDWDVAPRPAWTETGTKIEEPRVTPVIVSLQWFPPAMVCRMELCSKLLVKGLPHHLSFMG